MPTTIAILRSDAQVSIMHNPGELTDAEIDAKIERWQGSFVDAKATGWERVTEVPTDRTFRAAYKAEGGKVVVDLEGAKAIWKNKWREARKPLLSALDIHYMKAHETGDMDKLDNITDQKQQLRDVTATDLSGITTCEALKQVWPMVLGPQPEHLK
jgi:hypothetical protein